MVKPPKSAPTKKQDSGAGEANNHIRTFRAPQVVGLSPSSLPERGRPKRAGSDTAMPVAETRQGEILALVTCAVDDTADPDVLPAVRGYRDSDELAADLPEARRP
jgi:hypothetical protein